jgi:hypothetical protein
MDFVLLSQAAFGDLQITTLEASGNRLWTMQQVSKFFRPMQIEHENTSGFW